MSSYEILTKAALQSKRWLEWNQGSIEFGLQIQVVTYLKQMELELTADSFFTLLLLRLSENAIAGSPQVDVRDFASELLDSPIEDTFYKEIRDNLSQKLETQKLLCYEANLLLFKNYKEQQDYIQSYFLTYFTQDSSTEKKSRELPAYSWLESLNLEQRSACQMGFNSHHMMVIGGPGTGKTFTAARLCQLLSEKIAADRSKSSIKLALLAPTGKAVLRLEKSIVELLETLQSTSPKVEVISMTVHRFLQMEMGGYDSVYNPAPFDLVLLDEASMISERYLGKVFSSLSLKTQLILMGDPNQLPPLEGPSAFSLAAGLYLQGKWPSLSCSELKSSKRAQNSDLIKAAEAVCENNFTFWQELLSNPKQNLTYSCTESGKLAKATKRALENFFKDLDNYFLDGEEQVKELMIRATREVVLLASRKGTMGTHYVNETIFQTLKKASYNSSKPIVAIPVMATVNQATLESVNGEVGFVLLEKELFQKSACLSLAMDKAQVGYFNSSNSSNLDVMRKVAAIRLEKLDPAWAITIHKSQGSEFDKVLLFIDNQSLKYGKSLLYTGITRAKVSLDLLAEGDSLIKLLNGK